MPMVNDSSEHYVAGKLVLGIKHEDIPAKKHHFHVSTRQHLADPCHLGQVTPYLGHLLLCSDWIQLLIAVGL